MDKNLIAKPIVERFVLSCLDGDFKFDDDMNIIRDKNGIALLDDPETVYFESSVGDGKAKYWTDDINKAHVFTDMESAVSMLLQTNRKYSPVKILKLEQSIKCND